MAVPLRIIAYAAWMVFVLTWNIFDRPAKTVASPPARSERLYTLVIAAGIVLMAVGPMTAGKGSAWTNPPLIDDAMLLVMVVAIAWCWWARYHLGRLWSAHVTLKEGHRVADTGPDPFVRHPMYTGFIVMYVGMAIISTSPLAVAAVPVLTLGLWLKARVEEQFLVAQLDSLAYERYQARTPMLVPRIPR